MKKTEKISIEEARYLALHYQMLLDSRLLKTKKDLLKIIEQIGYVQIDTISIIERAHKHVLWTRFPSYKNEMLDELIDKDKKVFESWDHAAAYMPMKHYRFTIRRQQIYAGRYKQWGDKNRKLLKYVYERIKAEGPLQSRDFEEPSKRGLWWDWKPAKDALEFLFHTGKIALKARKNFQKVYDLPEKVFHPELDTTLPTDEEQSEHFIIKAISANGFASEKEMTYLRYHNRPATKNVLRRLLEDKKIIPVEIEGIDSEKYYTTKRILQQLNAHRITEHIHILSPFDNLVIQRKRLKTLFNFDYVIECYVPAPKRKFGYFCMPVLYGDKFIARIDAKADRAQKMLKVINIFWETDYKSKKMQNKLMPDISSRLLELAVFSRCEKISF